MFLFVPALKTINNPGEKFFGQKIVNCFKAKKYVAIHSLGLAQHKYKHYGEADFVLITDMGIFCIEVKGGSVTREDGVWTIGGSYTSNEGPFKQAQGTIHPIRKRLYQEDKNRAKKFPIGWGVVFPNSDFNEVDPEWENYHICNSNSINSPEKYITNLAINTQENLRITKGFTYTENITNDDINWALNCLRPDISSLSLSSINASKQEMSLLEESQKILGDNLTLNKENRHIISGGPGTGKTFIILEASHAISSENKLLLLCYNRNLSNYLSIKLREHRNITVSTYHSYAKKIIGPKVYDISRAQSNDKSLTHSKNQKKFFERILPDLLDDALLKQSESNNLEQFDWLMVDEGQDLATDEIINTMDFLIKGGINNGNFIFCYDKNVQAEIYNTLDLNALQRLSKVAINHPSYIRNYRNPKAIALRAGKIIGQKDIHTARSVSSTPRLHSCESSAKALEAKLNKIVSNLKNNGAKPDEISILTFKSKKGTALKNVSNISNSRLIHLDHANDIGEKIMWSTISSFKGLENEIIILVEASGIVLDDWYNSLLYVALTRTKTEFHYIGEKGDVVWKAIS